MLLLEGVSKTFQGGLAAVENVDLEVPDGSFTSIVGPSGCGKSTLLRMIAGLAEPSGGLIAGRPDGAVGLVFQDATLMPWADVATNVYLPLRLAGVSRADAQGRIDEMLGLVGLLDFAGAYPMALSGGMRMRVSIARALITQPSLLLMDEPFAALDEITRNKLNDVLLGLWRDRGFTTIFVTHSVLESVYLSTDIAIMTARPGTIFARHSLRGPRERDSSFRASAIYLKACHTISMELELAMRSRA
jgi:NitT/TauT family transport system ATP-binding protein